ncbi:HD domain-containing protein [Klebsiella pneumoniae]|uniref:HD domain-containing protein n=1 Tax=Klebsiella pneumoniae TaxID=573 RepID=A0A939NNT4_KLEPN|nr:HD domain-containing protein [Klebsiella pneumoniae]
MGDRHSAGRGEVDRLVLLTACYFHDIVSLPKIIRAKSILDDGRRENPRHSAVGFADFPADRYPAVSHAIEAHSFSAAIPPRTLEAKIVQDADRLESLGAIGLARVFAVAGALNTILFDAEDPFADRRALDDRKYASTISSANFCACRKPCKLTRGKRWRSIMPVFSSNLWLSSARSCREPLALDEAVLRRFAPQASIDR